MTVSPRSPRVASIVTRCSTGCGAVRGADHGAVAGQLRGVVPIAPVRSLAQALDVDELQATGHARGIPGRGLRSGAFRGPAAARLGVHTGVPARPGPGRRPGRGPRGAGLRPATAVDRLRAAGAFAGSEPAPCRGSIRPRSRPAPDGSGSGPARGHRLRRARARPWRSLGRAEATVASCP